MSNEFFVIASEINNIMSAISRAKQDRQTYIDVANVSSKAIEYLNKIGYDTSIQGDKIRIILYDK